MRVAEIVMAFVLGLFSLYVMWKAGDPPDWNPDVPRFANIWMVEGDGLGSGFWPFWLGLVMFLSCCWIAINWYRRLSPPSRSKERFLDSYALRMLILVGGGLFGFLLLISYLGFYVGIFLFLFYYLFFLGRHSLPRSLAVSTAMPVICFFFFDVAMRIVLPKGLSEPFFIPLYDIFL